MSKINKKFSLDITGILSLDDGIPKIEVEDMPDPIALSDIAREFENKEIKLTLGFKEEL